jgi:2-amino-4-hydroxy-6-hydroxymethyldihydropteridine diphosphokinase
MAQTAVDAYVALGANLGDPVAQLRQALHAMAQLPTTHVVRCSSFYASAPHEASGPEFVNAVAQLRTALDPQALLTALQNVENTAGRERPYPHAPRTLDLDVLFYGDQVLQTPTLIVPHPRWATRAFVLLPLHEICPQRVRAAQLQAVRNQPIRRLLPPPEEWNDETSS